MVQLEPSGLSAKLSTHLRPTSDLYAATLCVHIVKPPLSFSWQAALPVW